MGDSVREENMAQRVSVAAIKDMDWGRQSLSLGVKLKGVDVPQCMELDEQELWILVRLLERQVRPDVPPAVAISARLWKLHAVLKGMAQWASAHPLEVCDDV